MTGICQLSDEVLREFCHPEKAQLKDISVTYTYRGDLTETEARKTRAAIGEEAYAHLHYNTIVSDGQVLLYIPRYSHPLGKKHSFSPPASWYWTFGEIEDGREVTPATKREIKRVPANIQEKLSGHLEGVEFVKVRHLNIYCDGKPRKEKPPQDVLFFRFTGGLGVAIAPRPEKP